MKNKFLGVGASGCFMVLVGATSVGCGSSVDGGSNSAICDVDFADLAGTYSFKMTFGNIDYINSCFENYDNPPPDPDPAMFTNCTWSETNDSETITVELVVQDDGNIGNAKITSVTNSNGQPENIGIGVNCEMLKGELCNAPVRCTFSGDSCGSPVTPEPDEWKWNCNCYDGGMNDPMGQACQDCKVAYDKYIAESNSYCEKERASQYIEFTLNVK